MFESKCIQLSGLYHIHTVYRHGFVFVCRSSKLCICYCARIGYFISGVSDVLYAPVKHRLSSIYKFSQKKYITGAVSKMASHISRSMV